jgi:hypothetical protein
MRSAYMAANLCVNSDLATPWMHLQDGQERKIVFEAAPARVKKKKCTTVDSSLRHFALLQREFWPHTKTHTPIRRREVLLLRCLFSATMAIATR